MWYSVNIYVPYGFVGCARKNSCLGIDQIQINLSKIKESLKKIG